MFVNIKIKDSREFVWLYKVKMLKEQNEMLQEQLEAKLAATAVNDSSSSSAGLRSRPVRTCVCVCVCVWFVSLYKSNTRGHIKMLCGDQRLSDICLARSLPL